jgi:hypothetical protein
MSELKKTRIGPSACSSFTRKHTLHNYVFLITIVLPTAFCFFFFFAS